MRLKAVVSADAAAVEEVPDAPGKLPSQPSSNINNGMLLTSRPSADKDRRRYQQQLSLITGAQSAQATQL
uniref:SUZ domain-containing protein n=1 Tax=Macrostomum lignano TaxID=282301 RepID=A0A1I8I9G9_9PLAT